MINLLTKIRDYVKLLLPNDQKPTLLGNVLPDPKAEIWEEACIVSPPVNLPEEEERPTQEDKDKECDFIIEAFKSLSPEYILIVSEMRNLLNSDLKKIVFHALATKLSVEEVATHLGFTPQEVKDIFQAAIMDISIQSGFVREYLNNRIQKDREINELNSKLQLLRNQLVMEEIRHPAKKKTVSKIPYDRQKKLLSKPLTQCLDLETRTLTIFKSVDIYTLEDLLKYISTKGIATLTLQKNFGSISLDRLEKELIRKGIFDSNGHCELYQDMIKR
ncbi:hypothetical protein [Parabacteroides gordonii]|uniref:hypothetical protein n=1 Tax=Parabacteroides gordonii TaxID=574930 RepID=UPI000EBF62C5|nr:hypothetical protein [Parabacteroides gordonii]RGP18233.1 hypothetical protein DXB27_02090 [Parabacteroides gordonii]